MTYWDLDSIQRGGRREVYYLAHPVSGDEPGNIKRALAWLHWLIQHDPRRVYIAPWIAEVQASHASPDNAIPYERGLLDDKEVVDRCDGIILTGAASSPGMLRELAWAAAGGKKAIDLTGYDSPELFESYLRWLPGRDGPSVAGYLDSQVTQ